jgi:hypothetical protein
MSHSLSRTLLAASLAATLMLSASLVASAQQPTAQVAPPTSATTPSPQPAPALGRLFMTADMRAALERQRQLNIQEVQTLEGSTVTLNGVVTRSSGKRTVWINGQAQHDQAAPSGVTASTTPRAPGSAALSSGDDTPAQVQVGETVNRATHEKSDGLGGGQVSVNKGRSPAKR